jgi:uncharacterized protein
MELTNDFTVNAPMETAWSTLTDVERIAPCLPGAELQEIEGDVYRGVVKVKVGPITAQFKGQATFVERDEDAHRAVLRAEGRDTTGKGNASALITAQLEPVDGDATKVTVNTDLTITGKVAQFGRGALADVSDKLLKQFVTNLETTVLSDSGAAPAASDDGPGAEPAATSGNGAGTSATKASSTVRKVESRQVEPIDLIETAGAPMLKRLLPVIGGLVLIAFLVRHWRRR